MDPGIPTGPPHGIGSQPPDHRQSTRRPAHLDELMAELYNDQPNGNDVREETVVNVNPSGLRGQEQDRRPRVFLSHTAPRLFCKYTV